MASTQSRPASSTARVRPPHLRSPSRSRPSRRRSPPSSRSSVRRTRTATISPSPPSLRTSAGTRSPASRFSTETPTSAPRRCRMAPGRSRRRTFSLAPIISPPRRRISRATRLPLLCRRSRSTHPRPRSITPSAAQLHRKRGHGHTPERHQRFRVDRRLRLEERADVPGPDGTTSYEHGFYSTLSGVAGNLTRSTIPATRFSTSLVDTRPLQSPTTSSLSAVLSISDTGSPTMERSIRFPPVGFIVSASWPRYLWNARDHCGGRFGYSCARHQFERRDHRLVLRRVK